MAGLRTQVGLEGVIWIGTHFTVKSVVNKVEISLPAKKNAEILAALEELMDNARGMVKHADIRRLAGKESWVAGFLPQLKPFVRQLWASRYKDWGDQKVELVYKRQVWPALTWLRQIHQEHQQVLVRHLFLVDRLLDGLVLEVDASTTGRGAACWIGARHVAHKNPPVAYVVTQWTEQDEELLGTKRGDAAHQATWEAFMVLLAIRHFVTADVRGRIVLVGDALGVWFGTVRFCAKARKINEIAKEVAMHLAPVGHELEEVHIWSEMNTLADALSRVAESRVAPQGLSSARQGLLAKRSAETWTFFETFERRGVNCEKVTGSFTVRGGLALVCVSYGSEIVSVVFRENVLTLPAIDSQA